MNHWKKTVARSLGWIDHIRFGVDSVTTVPTVMRTNNTLAGSDPFVAKLNDSDPTVDRHRTPSSVPPPSSSPSAAARMSEVSKKADELQHQHQHDVDCRVSVSGSTSVLNTLLTLSVGFALGVAAVYHLKKR